MAAVKTVLCLAAVSVLLACQTDSQDVLASLSPQEQEIVAQYLDCIDCIVLLDSVRALGVRKPQATVDSLNRGLLFGPGGTAVAAAESVLTIGYRRDSTWRTQYGLSPLPPWNLYVSAARDRWVNGYRSRGAFGMGWIHTPRAVAHLDSAATLTLPPSVKWAVIYSRDSLPPP
jgi:hypothetical protein